MTEKEFTLLILGYALFVGIGMIIAYSKDR